MPEGRILVITGPTASGKTEHALDVARKNPNIEIVNADASLLYRRFDIGTAKPSKEVQNEVPHHVIDILGPDEPFNAAQYSARARAEILQVFEKGKIPIVVGGTGLYIDALFFGLPTIEVPSEDAKARYATEFQAFGFDTMHERLREIDPDLYLQIRRERNPIRLERAWTHYYTTGEPLGSARKRQAGRFPYDPEFTVLDRPRPVLWERIEARVDAMIAGGWLEEARQLQDAGVTRTMPAMRAIGYGEMFDVLDGICSMEQARERIIVRTRQYAKRQETWMKKYR